MRISAIAGFLRLFTVLSALVFHLTGCGGGDAHYERVNYNGFTLLVEKKILTPTQFKPGENVRIFASGFRTAGEVIQAVAEMTGADTDDAIYMLKSYDADDEVYVGEVVADP